MAGAWLRAYFNNLRILVDTEEQTRDDRVDFRNGFTASQVLQTDGTSLLTIDVDVAGATYEPGADTIPLRNGSGAMKATTMTATTFTYSSAVEMTYDEPVRVVAPLGSDWVINASVEPETVTTTAIEWATEIKPPAGSVLVSVAVVYTPANAHGVLPSDQPSIVFATVDESGTITAVESAQDTAADVASYETTRTLTLELSSPATIDAATRYLVVFVNEHGSDAESGLKLHRPARWTVEKTSV